MARKWIFLILFPSWTNCAPMPNVCHAWSPSVSVIGGYPTITTRFQCGILGSTNLCCGDSKCRTHIFVTTNQPMFPWTRHLLELQLQLMGRRNWPNRPYVVPINRKDTEHNNSSATKSNPSVNHIKRYSFTQTHNLADATIGFHQLSRLCI